METLHTPQGNFELARFPKRENDPLRAWDAADEYLLQWLAEQPGELSQCQPLLINDRFGSLSVALAPLKPVMISDSFIAHCATTANLQRNQLESEQVECHSSLEWPEQQFDLVMIKIPKSLAMLEDQLQRLRPLLHENSQVVAAAMSKQIHTSTLKLFERIIGPTHTSLAKKKARLVFAKPDLSMAVSPYEPLHRYTLEGTRYTIDNYANVFSRESLDIGSRFLLQHLPHDLGAKRVIDLGCGNGVIGLMVAHHNPQAELLFVDESFMAVASALSNFKAAFHGRGATFETMDCLSKVPAKSADIIINNPPFHQDNAVGDHIAWQMFKQSRQVLVDGGELWVIGNRHLGYHVKLKKLFGNCQTVASNKKFVIYQCIKQKKG